MYSNEQKTTFILIKEIRTLSITLYDHFDNNKKLKCQTFQKMQDKSDNAPNIHN